MLRIISDFRTRFSREEPPARFSALLRTRIKASRATEGPRSGVRWLKRLGSVLGAAGILGTIGTAIGPVAAGRIFDVSGSYTIALGVFAALWLGAFAIYARILVEQEIARLRPVLAGPDAP